MGFFASLFGFTDWFFVCKGKAEYSGAKLKVKNNKLPKWLYNVEFDYDCKTTYLKGNHFEYKVVITRPKEQGSFFYYCVYRKKREIKS